jgi:AI-2 transport protein TqsA
MAAMETRRDPLPQPLPGLLVSASLVIIVFGMRAAAEVLVPIAFAAFLTTLLAPVVRSLRRVHVPVVVGIPITVLSCVAVLSLFLTVVGQSINALIVSAPKYQERFLALSHGLVAMLRHHGIEMSQQRLLSSIGSERAFALLAQALSQLASLLSHLLLVLLLVLFLLVDTIDLPARLSNALGKTSMDVARLERIAAEVKQYLVLKTYLCLLTGLAVWIVLAFTGVDFAPLWALLSVLLGYVPNIGPFIATAPPVLLALLQVGPGRMVIVLTLLSSLHMVIGNVIEPHVLGRRLGLSAFTVFAALVIWGWIWGPAGMLLSVPLMVVIKILLENSPRYRYWAQLLEPAMTPPPARRLTPEAPDTSAMSVAAESPPPSDKNVEAGPKA